MNQIQHLVDISLKAHFDFMKDKFHNKWEKYGFFDANLNCSIANTIKNKKDQEMYYQGYGIYLALRRKIINNLRDRFITGWNKDYIEGIEKL